MRPIILKCVVLGVVVLVVGGITFMRSGEPSRESPRQETAAPREETPAESQKRQSDVATARPLRDAQVIFPITAVGGIQNSEHQVGGHEDFWFQNPNDYDVDIGVEAKSCKCAQIKLLNLDESEERALRGSLPPAAAADWLAGAAGLLPYLTTVGAAQVSIYPFMASSSRWRDLMVADSRGLPARKKSTGFVRLVWDGHKQDTIRLGVKLWVQRTGDPETRGGWTNLEVPVNIVPSLCVWPRALRLADMDSTSPTASAEFYAWSSTRANMTVLARESSGDPAFTCTLEQLTGPEFRATATWLTQGLQAEGPADFEEENATVPPQPVSLYRVKVIARDQPPEAPLDWGVFHRDITVTSDLGLMSIAVPVTGNMHGPIKSPAQILFETFPARDGRTTTIALTSNVPGISLQVEKRNPGYLGTDLRETREMDGTSRWELTVRVPPNRLMGAMPLDSAIVLRVQGAGSRRIRIPVLGKAVISAAGS
jgi:hypothetical protein